MSSQELDNYRLRGLLQTVDNMQSKALLLEKEEGGLTQFYTLLSMGKTVAQLANAIGATTFEMEYILKRTPEHRKQFLNASIGHVADASLVKLKHYGGQTDLFKEEAAGAKHHLSVVQMASKSLTEQDTERNDSKVVVNNTVMIADRNDIPPLPDGLENIIDIEEQDYAAIDS